VRRFSASLDITNAPRAADGTLDISGLITAQENAPERRKFTMQLANLYFISAKNAWQDNRADDAHDLALAARDLLTEFEKREPYERDTQLALAKTSSTLVDWGFSQYSDEMHSRYLKLAELFPTYPSLVATSATAMAKVGDNAMAIELAERAIATEESTKPWAVAWYAKGAALINLNSYDEAIEVFNTAIEKEPNSGSARLSHSALAFIYRQQGQLDLADFHTREAGG
jgi:tetratricopeptide (TPR) repeat protein